MKSQAAEDNPYRTLPPEPEALVESVQPARAYVRSLTEMFLLAQAGVAVVIWIWDAKKPVLVLLYAFVIAFFVRAVERSLLERANARRWRAAHSRLRAWGFSAIAAAGAWPFAEAAFGARPGAVSIAVIGVFATVGPFLAGLFEWDVDARTLRSDIKACGPLLLQSVLAAVALGLTAATIAPLLIYYVISIITVLAPCIGTVGTLLGAYAVVHLARPVPSGPAAYRTAVWLGVLIAAIHLVRAPFDGEPESPYVPVGLVLLAVALAVTAGWKARRVVFAVAATLSAGLIALSEHWLDTVAFAATAVVVAVGPLLDFIRQHAVVEDRTRKEP